MSAGGVAALIAAGFFAIGMIAGLIVLARLARLISVATTVVTGYSAAADELLGKARDVVQRADERLARTGELTRSVDEVTASMDELAEQVSAVAGTARMVSAGLGGPVLRLAALGHGLRYALGRQRTRTPMAGARLVAPSPAAGRPELGAERDAAAALPSSRRGRA